MKTTVDLPTDLLQEVKRRALNDGRKLKDAMADLLRKGLANSPQSTQSTRAQSSPRIAMDAATGLPLIICAADAPASRMTAAELMALEQKTLTQEDLERLGLSF